MAEPLVVKEGDASLRLVTDLPRFNWLELKLNGKLPSSGGSSHSATHPAAGGTGDRQSGHNNDSSICNVPLKTRILEMNSLKRRHQQEENCQQQQVKEESATVPPPAAHQELQPPPPPDSRWPLKKRLIVRQEEPATPLNPALADK